MNVADFLNKMIEVGASDVFIIAGLPLTYRKGGVQVRADDGALMPADTEEAVRAIYAAAGRDAEGFLASGNHDEDFSFALRGIQLILAA